MSTAYIYGTKVMTVDVLVALFKYAKQGERINIPQVLDTSLFCALDEIILYGVSYPKD